MTPFAIEDRRREDSHNHIVAFSALITRILQQFLRESIISPRGIGKRANFWELKISMEIVAAFFKLERDMAKAINRFNSIAISGSWNLWENFGLNDEEFEQAIKDEQMSYRKASVRRDFDIAVYRLIDPTYDISSDLPF